MADPNSMLSTLDRRFPIVAISLFGIALGSSTLFENDKRGLLRWDRPSAFASAKIGDLPGPGAYAITYLGEGDRGTRARTKGTTQPRGGASRSIPLVPETQTSPSSRGASSAVPLFAGPAQQFGASGTLAPASSTASAGGGPLNFTPGGLIGGETPFGLVAFVPDSGVTPVDPTDPVDPVVPAVPEPGAWLLMILGIGGLAAALRAQGGRRMNAGSEAVA